MKAVFTQFVLVLSAAIAVVGAANSQYDYGIRGAGKIMKESGDIVVGDMEEVQLLDQFFHYKASSVHNAWENHFGAFGTHDLDKMMLDYTEKSELTAFNFGQPESPTNPSYHTGLAEIRSYFDTLFTRLVDESALNAPIVDITEGPEKQVFLVWECPSSGYVSGTDTFFFDEDYKITKQNAVFTYVSN